MKKFIIILSVNAIAILTLNSCATSACKGGSCPIWSEIDHSEIEIKDLKFMDQIIVQHNSTADRFPVSEPML